jgi:asparagine synthase (glutamine-hydrolysing)
VLSILNFVAIFEPKNFEYSIMCGIAGCFGLSDNAVNVDRLNRMIRKLNHRGPDSENVWLNDSKSVGLAHARLSIIDLSNSASQPMHSSNGRYTIVFNGEIYNYIELKNELVKENIVFRTLSDTEVLLSLFEKYGSAMLPKLDGMFAFVIYDNIKNKIFGARDRFGEKPLYYILKDNMLLFASEIKALKEYDNTIKLNSIHLQNHLSGQKLAKTDTYYEEVKQLASSSYFEFNESEFKINTYWEINLSIENDITFNDAVIEFDRLLTKSITRRLRSDVPYGCSLSGGIDSSTIVSYLSSIDKNKVNTFSARFHSSKDEGVWIKEVVQKWGNLNHEIYPDPDNFILELDNLIYHHEYPIGSSSIYAQWCVMKLVKQNKVKVLLDGQGADEYLAGYSELKYFAIWEMYRKGNLKQFLKERRYFNENYSQDGQLGWNFLLDPLLKLIGFKRQIFKNGFTLKEQLKYSIENNLDELLRYADRNSMAHSIEVRLPFLFHELVEFVFTLPIDYIYREGKTKFILRETAKNYLPDKIYSRTDKIGFAPPQENWLESQSVKLELKNADNLLLDYGFELSPNRFSNLVSAKLIHGL